MTISTLLVSSSSKRIASSFLTVPSWSFSSEPKGRCMLAFCSLESSRLVAVAVVAASFSGRGRAGPTASMGEPQHNSEGPENFRYIQLWVSQDGESHIKECKMTGFRSEVYSSLPQFVKDDFGGQPEKIIFTELSVGLEQPLHPCPQVQFVVTLSGSWYIKTTDGAKHVFKQGEVLFQDNTKNTPAQKLGQHFSGAVGDVPCQQLIVQFDRPPEVDNPNPF